MHLITRLLLFSSGILLPAICLAGVTTGVDESAKLPYWELKTTDFSLRLVQRLPEQSRAFFMAQKFSKQHAELIAQNCMFQTVFKNISSDKNPSVIEYNLDDWKIIHKEKIYKMKTRELWLSEWKNKNISKSSMIVFEWGLFPTRQTYKKDDYNWGMSSFGLKPGSVFDLEIKILKNGKPVEFKIPSIQCSPDIHIEPEEIM